MSDATATEYTQVNEPHEDQLDVWAEQVLDRIEPWLKAFDSYDDKISCFRAIKGELREITEAAHTAGVIRARRASA